MGVTFTPDEGSVLYRLLAENSTDIILKTDCAGNLLHGLPTMEGRTPTFALTHPRRSPEELATELGNRDIATWWGNYYALEIMERLGLSHGALRIGFVHYNTPEEIDRVLAALAELR